MNKATSIIMHETSEGQRISYTYSVIDENTATLLSENNRDGLVLLNIPANKEVLGHIQAVKDYVQDYMDKKLGDKK